VRSDRLLIEDMLEAIDEVIECTPSAREAFDADKFLRSHLCGFGRARSSASASSYTVTGHVLPRRRIV
jgi:hypothetical protein